MENNNKKYIKIGILITSLVLIIISIVINPFNIRKSKAQLAIGNTNFSDQNFYSAVVAGYFDYLSDSEDDAALYNIFYDDYESSLDILSIPNIGNLTDTYNLAYKLKLSDDQLLYVKRVKGNNINDLIGVNKLPYLETIDVNGSFTTADFSKNLSLVNIDIKSPNLNKILLSNNNKLNRVNFKTNYFTKKYDNFIINERNISLNDIKKINFNNLSVKLYEDSELTNEIEQNTTELDGKYLVLTNDSNYTYKMQISYDYGDNDHIYVNDSALYAEIIKEYNKENSANYDTSYSLTKKEASKIKKLIVDCRENNISISNLNDVEYLTNLEELSVNYCNLDSLPYSFVNYNLKKLDLSNNNYSSFDSSAFPYLQELDLSNNTNLETLLLSSIFLKKLKLDNSTNISNMVLAVPNLENAEFLNNLPNLQMVMILYSKIKTLDISNTNITYANFSFSEFTKTKINMLVNETKKLDNNIRLNSQLELNEIYNEDDYVASYFDENITANHTGQTTITKYYSGINTSAFFGNENPLMPLPIKIYIYVYDVTSTKFNVNKDYKYIFTGSETDKKVINRYVKVFGENVKKKYENNSIKLLVDDDEIYSFDIINVSSDKYTIDKDKIKYSGSFDIDKINVLNAEKMLVNGNKLVITKDNVLVKEYNLERIGD